MRWVKGIDECTTTSYQWRHFLDRLFWLRNWKRWLWNRFLEQWWTIFVNVVVVGVMNIRIRHFPAMTLWTCEIPRCGRWNGCRVSGNSFETWHWGFLGPRLSLERAGSMTWHCKHLSVVGIVIENRVVDVFGVWIIVETDFFLQLFHARVIFVLVIFLNKWRQLDSRNKRRIRDLLVGGVKAQIYPMWHGVVIDRCKRRVFVVEFEQGNGMQRLFSDAH